MGTNVLRNEIFFFVNHGVVQKRTIDERLGSFGKILKNYGFLTEQTIFNKLKKNDSFSKRSMLSNKLIFF